MLILVSSSKKPLQHLFLKQSTIKELELENARLKQISSYEENVSMRKELSRVKFISYFSLIKMPFQLRTENANLRSGVQTKIQLKSALRSTVLAPDKSHMRSTMSHERSFIVRRGIFELLPVLSVRPFFVKIFLFNNFRFEKKSIAYNAYQTSYSRHCASSKRLKYRLQQFQQRLERQQQRLLYWLKSIVFWRNR